MKGGEDLSNWQSYDRLLSENRSNVARRARPVVKLLIKKEGGRFVKSQKGRSGKGRSVRPRASIRR